MSAPVLAYQDAAVRLYCCSHQELAAYLRETGEQCDSVLFDAPYSERTHQGHDDGTAQANRVADWAAAKAARGETRTRTGLVATKVRNADLEGANRRELNYAPWTSADVDACCDAWLPLVTGWAFSQTDHILAPAWCAAMERHRLYVFSPLACTEAGSRFRATGDGHSQWSVWGVAGRPASMEWLTAWREARRARDLPCALRGAYDAPAGEGDACSGRRATRVPGGKPLAMQLQIIDDHCEPGQLLAVPCAGGGTELVAARLLGVRAVGCDTDAHHCEMAAAWLRGEPAWARMRLRGPRGSLGTETQPALFTEGDDAA